MMNNIKFLPIGLVLGGGIGIVFGAAMNDIPMGIVSAFALRASASCG